MPYLPTTELRDLCLDVTDDMIDNSIQNLDFKKKIVTGD